MSIPLNWIAPLKLSELTPDTVHLWRIDTRSLIQHLRHFACTLTADETERANRYRLDVHRQDFIIHRGVLRSLLGRYLQCDAGTVSFQYGAYGKPALTPDLNHQSLCFNVSHSQGLGLCAIALNCEVGVDVECIRSIAVMPLAERFFTPQEYDALRSLPVDQQQDAFFQLWTCKEALVKATGEGLQGLKQADVSFVLNPQQPSPQQFQLQEHCQEWCEGWLQVIDVDPGYKGAIAVRGQPLNLQSWIWNPNFLYTGKIRLKDKG